MKKIIEPKILKGTRDFLPPQMMRRNNVMGIIKGTFEQFGYSPIETPILSLASTILGKYGDEGDRLTYSFNDRGGRKIALPYDLTVPFARYFAANYRSLPIPFKRYQVQRVWRAERPQKGRLREFYQCDIDIIGSNELICEAEIVKIIVTVFSRLSIDDFKIKINSRRLLNAILSDFGLKSKDILATIRVIDKLDKIGELAVIDELKQIGIKQAEQIVAKIRPETSNAKTIKKLAKYDITGIQGLMSLCRQISVPDSNLLIDPSLARGLDYYTGIVFEVVIDGSGMGTICAGGRYDNLCSLFSGQNFSGIGVAFGFERIMLLMEQRKLFTNNGSTSKVLVSVFSKAEMLSSLATYNNLVTANIPAEIYVGAENLSKQLKFADKKGIPFVVIQGPDEIKNNELIIRKMSTGKQKIIPTSNLISYIGGYYETR